MKKFVLTICVVIICMVTALFYGKTGIKTTTGVHDPDTVSYTHLDVYKRQELYYHDRTILHIQCPKHKMTSKCCRMIFPFYSACITQQTEMIRDVYKRQGIGRNTLRNLVEWEKLPILRVGRKILIRRRCV